MPSRADRPCTSQPQSSFDCERINKRGKPCRKSFETAEKLAHHAATVHDRWECVVPLCPFNNLRGYEKLVAHMEMKHSLLVPVSCNMCSMESAKFADWRRHAKQKHRGCKFAAKKRSNRRRRAAQGDDVQAPTIKSEPKEENVTQDEVGQDVEESPTTENSGRSGADDVGGSSRCPVCWCKLDDEQAALIHAETEHKAREARVAQCQVCEEYVMYDELAKHGLQKHIQEVWVHCPFCNERMKHIDLFSHAIMCPMLPQKLDLATVHSALKEGRIPGSVSELEARGTGDTTRPGTFLNSVVLPEEPTIPSVAIKQEE